MADTFRSYLIDIEPVGAQSLMLKFSNGRVAFTHQEMTGSHSHPYQVLVDEQQNLIRIKEDKNLEDYNRSVLKTISPSIDLTPTVLSQTYAFDVFNRLNATYKRSSECSNRAHVWAWEEFKNNKTISEKVYVLFTASYINRHRFKWWFHVAPLFTVKKGNQTEKWVFDYMFNPRPVTMKEWTDGFVFSRRSCRYTERFSEYDVNPQTEDCYLMIDSMFTWTPIDLKNQELYGRFKSQFSMGEINFAYKQAFN